MQKLPVFALVTTGRTGSDFLQSLLDSHPQIATFNGYFAIYSEFFSRSMIFSSPEACVSDVVDEFIGKYLYKLVSRYDIQEAKDRLGENSDQSFRIDTADFKVHMIGMLDGEPLSSRNFLLAIYAAYNLCLGRRIEEFRILLHHPHLDYEFRLFIKDFPQSRIIFTSRDPRANFCSHVEHFARYYQTHDNQQHILNCLKMALEDSGLADEYGSDYIATRLEDLPREDVMRALANWLGVEYVHSMTRSTWAGLDWHGDRISDKKFPASGWSSSRTENGWQDRLGWSEKTVLDYLMYDRLKWYGYPVSPTTLRYAALIPFLILVPFKCERRLLSLSHIYKVLISGDRTMRVQIFLGLPFLWRRIMLCYRYYWRTLTGVPFRRKWLRVKSPQFD